MTYIQINIQKSRKWRGWKVRTVILWIRSLLWYQLCGFLLLSKLDRCYLHTFMSIRIKNTKQSLLLFIFNFLIFFIKCSIWKVMDRRPPPPTRYPIPFVCSPSLDEEDERKKCCCKILLFFLIWTLISINCVTGLLRP